MGKQAIIIEFLKPTWMRMLLAVVFLLVTAAGSIQTYVFTCGGDGHKCIGTGIENPLFYDEVQPYPFWLSMVFLLLALILVTDGFGAGLADPVVGTITVIYLYLSASLIMFLGNIARKNWFGRPQQNIVH